MIVIDYLKLSDTCLLEKSIFLVPKLDKYTKTGDLTSLDNMFLNINVNFANTYRVYKNYPIGPYLLAYREYINSVETIINNESYRPIIIDSEIVKYNICLNLGNDLYSRYKYIINHNKVYFQITDRVELLNSKLSSILPTINESDLFIKAANFSELNDSMSKLFLKLKSDNLLHNKLKLHITTYKLLKLIDNG